MANGYMPSDLINDDEEELQDWRTRPLAWMGEKPPALTPTGQPSIAQTAPAEPLWTELPPPGPGYNLARGLGMAAAAIAPGSIGGRLGAAASTLAAQDEADRIHRIERGTALREAQERTGLARMTRQLQAQQMDEKLKRDAAWQKLATNKGLINSMSTKMGLEPDLVSALFESMRDKPLNDILRTMTGGGKDEVPQGFMDAMGHPELEGQGLTMGALKTLAPMLRPGKTTYAPKWIVEKDTNRMVDLNAPENKGKNIQGYPPASMIPGNVYHTDETGRVFVAPSKGPASMTPVPGITKRVPEAGGKDDESKIIAMRKEYQAHIDRLDADFNKWVEKNPNVANNSQEYYDRTAKYNDALKRLYNQYGPWFQKWGLPGWEQGAGQATPQSGTIQPRKPGETIDQWKARTGR